MQIYLATEELIVMESHDCIKDSPNTLVLSFGVLAKHRPTLEALNLPYIYKQNERLSYQELDIEWFRSILTQYGNMDPDKLKEKSLQGNPYIRLIVRSERMKNNLKLLGHKFDGVWPWLKDNQK